MLIQDVRYGLRLIRKAPGFSVVAIASLAVGIGASTVLFSVANALLFRPVSGDGAGSLIQVFTSNSSGPLYGSSSYPDYEAIRDVPVFDGLLASMRARATLSDDGQADVINGLLVSGNYFDVLGLRAWRGRFFSAEEGFARGAPPVAVLSHHTWQRRFGTDPEIIGRVVELNGMAFTVIGVGPPRFTGTGIEDMAEFFVPVMMHDAIMPERNIVQNRRARTFRILGRLKDGVSVAEANAALRVTAAGLLRHDPEAWRDAAGRGRVITLMPERSARFVGAGPGTVLFILSSVTAGVLALLGIACINVATVLLARATARRKEIAVRLAIGASRRRIVRQLLTECALLAAAGGALGLMLAQAIAALFGRLRPEGVPAVDLTADYRILLFSTGASLFTVFFFGLAPALQTTRPDINEELRDRARAFRFRWFRFGLRDGLVVIQVALSLALVIGAALMLRSSWAGRTDDPGFRRDDVLSVGIDLSMIPESRRARFYEEAIRSVAALPSIELTALAGLVPMDGSNSQTTVRIGDGPPATVTSPDINIVGPGYFALLDIPIRQGREFTSFDRASTPLVAVANETMARQFWNGEAVGRTFTHVGTGDQVHIVGVVRDLRHRSFGEPPLPMIYFCASQRPRPRMTLHVRTAVSPQVLAPVLQRTLHEIDRTAGLGRVETMDDHFDRATMPQRIGAGAAIAIGGLELGLAVMALYGVIAFAVSQRTREIGVRLALGASNQSVIALIMREGLLLTGIGVMLGVAIALAGGAALSSLLIGIGPADPVSFGIAIPALLLVGALASYLPARRASSVDPSIALRSE